MPIYIGMAAQPRRFPNLEISVPILAKQCDKLWIVVNPEDSKTVEEPTPQLPAVFDEFDNLEIIINSKNLGDKEKFIGMQYQDKGYFFSIDDDILYPSDYVEKHIEFMFQIENWGITCVHASTFSPFGNTDGFAGKRKMYHFEWEQRALEKVLMPGTGTACYDVSTFKMLPEEQPTTNMADVWVACKAAQRGVPVYTIPRPNAWLKGLPSYGDAICENRPDKAMNDAVRGNRSHLQKMFGRLHEQ